GPLPGPGVLLLGRHLLGRLLGLALQGGVSALLLSPGRRRALYAGRLALALLDDVGELVGDEPPTLLRRGAVLARAEDEIPGAGVAERAHRAGRLSGAVVVEPPPPAEVMPEPRLHHPAHAGLQRLPARPRRLLRPGALLARARAARRGAAPALA